MLPFVVLVVAALLARLAGILGAPGLDAWSPSVAVGLTVMLVLTASAHFTSPRREGLVAVVPPALPRPDLLVTLTGVLEALAAVGLLLPAVRSTAATCLALLLVAMYPANVRAATGRRHEHAPTTPLALRTVLQVVFVVACVVVVLGGR